MSLTAVQCMLTHVWVIKACMLLTFARMTSGTIYLRWIKIVAVWVVLGYVAVQVTISTACRPFTGYWTVPPPNPQCRMRQHYAIVQAIFNISTDLSIIAVPIPMVASITLPIKQKIGLRILFNMGIFVVRCFETHLLFTCSLTNISRPGPDHRRHCQQSLHSLQRIMLQRT
jgi:hypothetical protein